ncbi:hypothetical protein [Leptobacterium sp. I13]|uniref:hypothetical protein n=1 Tax=Leptobacterium meishanense TaxID=3128904 RepID=UPI0030EB9D28
MGYTIFHRSGMLGVKCDSYESLRVYEAFLRGMKMDYTIIYPDETRMQVSFKENKMTQITELDEKIDELKKQLLYLADNKHISEKERNELRTYYENKLTDYTDSKTALIKNIAVDAEVLHPGGEQDREKVEIRGTFFRK